jgi:hypothetical protein
MFKWIEKYLAKKEQSNIKEVKNLLKIKTSPKEKTIDDHLSELGKRWNDSESKPKLVLCGDGHGHYWVKSSVDLNENDSNHIVM